MTKDEALKLALEALEEAADAIDSWGSYASGYFQVKHDLENDISKAKSAITAIKAALLSRSDGEAKDEKQKPVNIKKVAEEHGINLPTEFVPKHDESKAAIQSLTDQCAALIWERDELQKQMWRSEKQEQEPFSWGGDPSTQDYASTQPEQEPVTWRYKIVDVFGRPVWTLKTPKSDTRVLESQPLYTTPPQRKPLTDEELRVIENKINPNMRWRSSDEEGITLYPIEYYELVRAIEAAHGIKGEA